MLYSSQLTNNYIRSNEKSEKYKLRKGIIDIGREDRLIQFSNINLIQKRIFTNIAKEFLKIRYFYQNN